MSLTSTVWKVLSSRPPKLCKNSVSEAYFHIVKAISIGRPQYVDGRFSSKAATVACSEANEHDSTNDTRI